MVDNRTSVNYNEFKIINKVRHMNIGAKIVSMREKAQLSQRELSFRAGISPAALHYIEQNINSPTHRTLEKLAAALGISVTELLDEPKTGTEN
jgi:transcriptional regulator with XRE-family HTH domain